MNELNDEIIKTYGNKLRVRVCGLCFEGDKILLIKHHNLGKTGVLWAPPGGGLQFGESAEASLIREFQEETGLTVAVKDFLFVNEYLASPLHAIELFFEVSIISGKPKIGKDPEMPDEMQILHDIRFFHWDEIKKQPANIFHSILNRYSQFTEFKKMRGYYKYENSL